MASEPSQAELLLKVCADIVSELSKAYDAGRTVSLNAVKTAAAKRAGLKSVPRSVICPTGIAHPRSLVDIIAAVPEDRREQLLPLLRAKPIRTASGIAVVAVMSKPHRCPHIATTGNICVYCPGGPDSDFAYSTQARRLAGRG